MIRLLAKNVSGEMMPGFILAAITALTAGVVPATEGSSMNATLETSQGNAATLLALVTKPTVLFYEDRDSTTLNQHVKDALFEKGKTSGKLDAIAVIAIANVKDWNWFPARNFVLKAVRDLEAKFHIPIYLDFTGGMTLPPWSLPGKTSTVVVMTSKAQPIVQFKGRLSDDDEAKLFAMLENLAQP
jgi:hypothetical protein